MLLTQWFDRWSIPPLARQELLQSYAAEMASPLHAGMSEGGVQSVVRLQIPKNGDIAWRNNVGALKDMNGRPVRFGLCNDSKAINERFKSGDLIGIHRLLITPEHVGQVVGQFASWECKHADWRPGEDPERELAQQNWAHMVVAYGGMAKFTTGKV